MALGDATNTQKTFTFTLSNGTFEISPSWGVSQVTVLCTTATAGTILGTGNLGTNASTGISIGQNVSWSAVAPPGKSLDTIRFTAPTGCTLLITANAE